jgi:uncharacterized protein (TIGR00369 family)
MGAEDTIVKWEAEEKAVRAKLQAIPGVARPEQVAGRTGLEMLEMMLAGALPPPPIASVLDFAILRVGPGTALFQGRPQFKHYNPLGVVHGGWVATLLDSAMGCAVHSTLPAGKGYTTLELKVNFVRAVTDAVPLVRVEGKVIHAGKQVAVAEGRLFAPDGKLHAHATTTCLIFDRPSAGA